MSNNKPSLVKYYYEILHNEKTSGKLLEALCHECLIDIINARDSHDYELEKELQGVLIYFLADKRIPDHTKIYSRIRGLF